MTLQEAKQQIPPGRYRHFKGNEYEVLDIAQHSETEEPMVVYRALYGKHGLWKVVVYGDATETEKESNENPGTRRC